MISPRTMLIVRIVAIAAIAAGLWFFARHLDIGQLGHAFASAKIWPLVIAPAMNFLCLFGKAASWKVMFHPRYRVSLWRLWRLTIAAFAGSAIAPARAGELLRLIALKRRDGIPKAQTAAVAVAEKLLDALTILLLVVPVPWLVPGLPHWVGSAIGLCTGVALLLFAVLWVAVGRVDVTEKSSWVKRFISGMHVLHSPRRLLLASVILIGVWLADLAQTMLVLHALGIELPIWAGLMVLFCVNLTIVVPSTPAQVGALQVGALVGLELFGVRGEAALAFALLYHALQIIPLIIVGLILEMPLVLGRDRPQADTEDTNTEYTALPP
jgi:glycosyltransferase 2 family protein